jgi:creatinine deaminase
MVIAVGRNRRVPQDSAIRRGETDCLENAGRQPASVYARATMY